MACGMLRLVVTDDGNSLKHEIELLPKSYFLFYLWSPYVIGQTIYIFILSSVFLSFFSSANLSGWRLDVCHTSTHGVALVRI